MEFTDLTYKKQIATAIRRDGERQAKKMLKKEQPPESEDKETLMATLEQEQMIDKDKLWINVKTGVA